MGLGDKLFSFRNQQKRKSYKDSFDLQSQVDDFITWYGLYLQKFYQLNKTEDEENKMKNFIEKMAVWYELRYPDYEIEKIYGMKNDSLRNVNDSMLMDNKYIDKELGDDSVAKCLDWAQLYNSDVFFASLTDEEKSYFSSPKYPEIVYVDNLHYSTHFHLNKDGYIEMAEFISSLPGTLHFNDEYFEGKHIKEFVDIISKDGFKLPEGSEVELAIAMDDLSKYCKEEILNCVMKRILIRGGRLFGPRRAMLFAKEFSRNIEVPMQYAIDFNDANLWPFVKDYLMMGGDENIECYPYYFLEKLGIISVGGTASLKDVLKTFPAYEQEKKELHQRMVNALQKGIDPESLQKEQLQQQRLERRLEKSRSRR